MRDKQIQTVAIIVAAIVGLHVLAMLSPPLEHWLTFFSAKFLIGLAFWLVASFWGASVMALQKHYLWILALLGVAFVAVSLWEGAVNDYRASNFCYFKATLNDRRNDGGFEWQLVNKQQRDIPFRQMNRFVMVSGKSKFAGDWKAGVCLPEAINQTTANEEPIKPGHHLFRWHAENGWQQLLVIRAPEDGAPSQTGIVYRGGEEILRFEE